MSLITLFYNTIFFYVLILLPFLYTKIYKFNIPNSLAVYKYKLKKNKK